MSYTTLVDVETLRAHLDDPNWLVVDVRHQLADTGSASAPMLPGTFPAPYSCTATGIFPA